MPIGTRTLRDFRRARSALISALKRAEKMLNDPNPEVVRWALYVIAQLAPNVVKLADLLDPLEENYREWKRAKKAAAELTEGEEEEEEDPEEIKRLIKKALMVEMGLIKPPR
ncbi:hypothetical protein [Thermus filiformis]|nr:hypothetical protein [Thermus filiformis]